MINNNEACKCKYCTQYNSLGCSFGYDKETNYCDEYVESPCISCHRNDSNCDLFDFVDRCSGECLYYLHKQ